MLRVVVIGPAQAIYYEADAAEAITPGHVIKLNGTGGAIKNTVAGAATTAKANQVMVAVENDIFGKGIDDAYAIGDRVIYQHLQAGHEFMGLVPAAAGAIVFDDYVTTDGAGGIVKGDVNNAIGKARLAVDNSAGASAARIRVHVGN